MILTPVAIPETDTTGRGRKAEPNPFVDGDFAAAFKALPIDGDAGKVGNALALEIPGLNDVKTNKELAKVLRLLRTAGYVSEPKRTIRTKLEQILGADKKPSVRVTFWAITFVQRRTKEELTAIKAAEEKAAAAKEGTETALDSQLETAERVAAQDNEDTDTPENTPAKPVRGTTRRSGK